MSDVELVKFYNDANRQVAVLCNHQKAVSKTHDASMDKLKEKLKALQDQIKEESAVLKKGEKKGEDVTKQKNKVDKLKDQEMKMNTNAKMKEDRDDQDVEAGHRASHPTAAADGCQRILQVLWL